MGRALLTIPATATNSPPGSMSSSVSSERGEANVDPTGTDKSSFCTPDYLIKQHPLPHPRTVGWFGTTSVAMGGINQSLFLLSALFIGQGAIPGQGSAAVVLLGVGLLLSWAATPGWTELILMYPNRVGGIAATCAEAFRPYSPILANLTGVCYWWGWVPTCGLTALLASSALHQSYLPWFPVPLLASCIVLFFTFVN